MNLGLFVLRVVVGALFMGHGAQKLYGWFGGSGPNRTGAFFESLGLRPGRPMALAAGASEFVGGVLIAFGFLTPLGALLITGVMTVAFITVHREKGVWVTEGGFEYVLVNAAIVFALTGTGPGRWSLDHALSINWRGFRVAIAELVVAAIGGALAVAFARSRAQRSSQGGAHPTAA